MIAPELWTTRYQFKTELWTKRWRKIRFLAHAKYRNCRILFILLNVVKLLKRQIDNDVYGRHIRNMSGYSKLSPVSRHLVDIRVNISGFFVSLRESRNSRNLGPGRSAVYACAGEAELFLTGRAGFRVSNTRPRPRTPSLGQVYNCTR